MEEAVRIELDHHASRIGEIEEDLKELKRIAISVEKLAIQMENMTKMQTKLTKDVEEIKNRPAAAWNNATKTILTTIISVIAGGLAVALVQAVASHM